VLTPRNAQQAELAARYQKGDRNALAELLADIDKCLAWHVHRFLVKCGAERDPWLRADLEQEARLIAMECAGTFRPGAASYLNFVITALWLRIRQVRCKLRVVPIPYNPPRNPDEAELQERACAVATMGDSDAWEQARRMATPDRHVDDIDRRDLAEYALAALSDGERQAVRHVYGVGAELRMQREVAHIMGGGTSHMSRRMQKCYEAMRERLEGAA
jgi:DNA-directed RNA polymerase specialized sigma24 family protein